MFRDWSLYSFICNHREYTNDTCPYAMSVEETIEAKTADKIIKLDNIMIQTFPDKEKFLEMLPFHEACNAF